MQASVSIDLISTLKLKCRLRTRYTKSSGKMLMSGKALNGLSLYWSDFLNTQVMTPLSYQGFGFTAILVMVGILSFAHLLKFLKERFSHQQEDKKAERSKLKA